MTIGKGTRPDKLRRFCPKGHDTEITGRSPNPDMRTCLACDAERSREPKRQESRRRAAAGAKRLKEFGLSPAAYEAMAAAQEWKCAICLEVPRSKRGLCVDHDHATGAVRALLCWHCNASLGMLRDAPAVVDSAAAYLRKHGRV